jgi:hypothetical protein
MACKWMGCDGREGITRTTVPRLSEGNPPTSVSGLMWNSRLTSLMPFQRGLEFAKSVVDG